MEFFDQEEKGSELTLKLNYRSPRNAVKELKKIDPGCEVTEFAIRLWIEEGKLKFVSVGRKKMILMSSLFEYLERGEYITRPVDQDRPVEVPTKNGIRRIAV